VIGTPTKRSGFLHREAKLLNNLKVAGISGIWVEPPEKPKLQRSQSASNLGLFCCLKTKIQELPFRTQRSE